MKRIILLFVLLVIAISTISFTLTNSQPVMLKYYFGEKETDLLVVIVFSVAIGAVLGVLATMGLVLRLKHDLVKLKKTVRVTEKEVENLRSLPLKDPH
ncbi:MAG: LapA family protein [Gammaproteobacteria bacterium]|nr:LapA family protein [Gammaproteobacteria bacterium]MDH5801244.1 LapA family protein [Gammaproteobacteria bacterium]